MIHILYTDYLDGSHYERALYLTDSLVVVSSTEVVVGKLWLFVYNSDGSIRVQFYENWGTIKMYGDETLTIVR